MKTKGHFSVFHLISKSVLHLIPVGIAGWAPLDTQKTVIGHHVILKVAKDILCL